MCLTLSRVYGYRRRPSSWRRVGGKYSNGMDERAEESGRGQQEGKQRAEISDTFIYRMTCKYAEVSDKS